MCLSNSAGKIDFSAHGGRTKKDWQKLKVDS
jgi:hypothetical protein